MRAAVQKERCAFQVDSTARQVSTSVACAMRNTAPESAIVPHRGCQTSGCRRNWRRPSSRLAGLRQFRLQPEVSHPRWGTIALSGAVFLIAHATLVLTWRAVLSTWNAHLSFWTAARIWSVSNLGRYIPGKVWQIGAMGAMARQVDVSPVAASASALLGTLVNILAGFAVSLVSGRVLLDRSATGGGAGTAPLLRIAAGAPVFTPLLLPRVTPVVARLLDRPVQATLPVMAVVFFIVGDNLAWVPYRLGVWPFWSRGICLTP